LACIYGGLTSASRLLGDELLGDRAIQVRELLLSSAHANGYFVKSSANVDVDASALWLATPFGVVDAHDGFLATTASRIETSLTLNGGIRRYPTDVYFGSGAWPVLTATLGWYHVATGQLSRAQSCLEWIVEHFDDQGLLGEQFDGELRDPVHHGFWVEKWGPPAKDLMWSHAMFIVLALKLARARAEEDHAANRVDSGRDSGIRTT
jgi:GH15 family glucan-1,4-alpha-glucosidase